MSDSDSVNTIDETVSTKKYGKFNLNANFKFGLCMSINVSTS